MTTAWTRRQCLSIALACSLGAIVAPAAQAEAKFPSKPITLIVPWPAGGSTDRHMRAVAQEASKELGQPVVVENRPGAGGTLGPSSMASAKPDGYTISQFPLGMLRMPHMQKTSYHPIEDFTFIMGLSGYLFGVAVPADSPFKTFDEYIDAARQNPGKIDYGSTGIGSSPHLLMEEIALNTGIELVHVPYKGNADMQQAVLGGHIMAQSDAAGWAQFVDSGRMRLLVTFGPERTKRWPDVPTAKELGYKVVSTSPYGLAGPKGMDPAVVKILHDAFKKALFSDHSMEVMEQLNQSPNYQDGEAFRQWAAETFAKDKELIDYLGLSSK